MYQFTGQTVINSLTDASGLAKFAASTDNSTLIARKIGNFKVANIDFAGSVYKAAYTVGVLEQAKVTIPTVTAGKVIRATLDIRLSQQTDSEYASTYLYFKKPVVVEVLATGTAATDAINLAAAITSLKTTYGFSYVTAAQINTADLQITATNNNQRVFAITIESDKTSTNSLIQPEYDDITASFSVTRAGVVGFGDDEYMIRSIMLPTYENTRYFGTNKEERPVLGGNYSQYTFGYTITKDSDPGIVSGAKSKTTQVFYVQSGAMATAFELILTNLGLTIVASHPGAGAFKLTSPDSTIVVGDFTTIVPVGAIGAVTYVSGTVATIATVSALGVTSVGLQAGTTLVTATDSTGATATITLTVIA